MNITSSKLGNLFTPSKPSSLPEAGEKKAKLDNFTPSESGYKFIGEKDLRAAATGLALGGLTTAATYSSLGSSSIQLGGSFGLGVTAGKVAKNVFEGRSLENKIMAAAGIVVLSTGAAALMFSGSSAIAVGGGLGLGFISGQTIFDNPQKW